MQHFRPAMPADASRICDFQIRMAWETEKLRLDPKTCDAGVRAVFARPHLGTYYVCEFEGTVIGSLLVVTEWSDWRNGECWWIHSVYLEPEFRGRGLFAQFYAYVKSLVVDSPQARGLRLYVDRTNVKAQAVYARIGMNCDHYLLYEWMKP